MTTPSRARLALAGLVTGLAGVAVSGAATSLLRQRATPIHAVAEAVVEETPGRLAEWLISLVGQNDKPILIAGVTTLVLGLSALAGLLTVRSRLAASAVFLAMGGIALASVLTRPNATPTAALPVLLGVVTWLVVLPFLATPVLQPAAGEADPAVTGPDRRQFLTRTGAVVAAAGVVGLGGRYFGRARRAVESARARLRLPVTAGTVPAGADLDLPGLTPWRVPNKDFYRIDTALILPAVTAEDWRLRIHGLVDQELTLTYDDLLARQLTEAWVTICCVSNPVGGDLVGNAWWSGVRVADLLAEAGPHADADAVRQTSQDGWSCGTPLAALTDDRNALLAIAMNGEPLPVEHGFPVRMVVPGLYGFVSATKWVVDLEVTRFSDFTAYWTERGWSAEGPVKTQSRVEVPRSHGRVTSGEVRVGGTAWAQHTGVSTVEVRLDGGPWTPVDLARVPSEDTWVQWSGSVEAAPGTHSLAVRATDHSGYQQTGVRTEVAPDGATGWHTIEFTAE